MPQLLRRSWGILFSAPTVFPVPPPSRRDTRATVPVDTLGLEGTLRFKLVISGRFVLQVLCLSLLPGTGALAPAAAQQDAKAAILQGIDASVHARENNLLGYTVTEHYAVFRNHDEQHPAAEMVVKTSYQRDVGKNFSIVSETGSLLLRKMLTSILDNERKMTQPANRATAVITPGNYEMTVKEPETVDGRNCTAVAIVPRRLSPYLFNGTIWVDAQNQSIVQLKGISAKSPSMFTGPSEIFRQYAVIDGFPMATHAKAVSNSSLLGQTILKIDYIGYQVQLRAAK